MLQQLQTLLNTTFPTAQITISNGKLRMSEKNTFIGDVIIQDKHTFVWFDQIYVKTSEQRKGVGTTVLGAVVQASKAAGYTHIECRPTAGGELHGLDFCQKNGFTDVGGGVWRLYS
jgi:hypothetical protein